jgi:hypothetical protein
MRQVHEWVGAIELRLAGLPPLAYHSRNRPLISLMQMLRLITSAA